MKRKRWAVLLVPVNHALVKDFVDHHEVEDYTDRWGRTSKAVIYNRRKADAQHAAIMLAYWIGRKGGRYAPYPEVVEI